MPYLTLISTKNQDKYDNAIHTQHLGTFFSKDIDIKLQPGDLFLFINGIHYAGDGKTPDGFPVGIELTSFPFEIDEIRRAEIRSESHNQGKIEFSFKDPDNNVQSDELNDEIIAAIQSCINGEELVEIELTTFFDYTA